MALTLSSCSFLLNFLFLPVFVVVFVVKRLIVMTHWWLMNDKYHWTPIEAEFTVFLIPCEAIEFNGFDTTGFWVFFSVFLPEKFHSCSKLIEIF